MSHSLAKCVPFLLLSFSLNLFSKDQILSSYEKNIPASLVKEGAAFIDANLLDDKALFLTKDSLYLLNLITHESKKMVLLQDKEDKLLERLAVKDSKILIWSKDFRYEVTLEPFHIHRVKDLASNNQEEHIENGVSYSHTPYEVIRRRGDKIIEVIPVTSSRLLQSMDISKDEHTFWFDDGLLEVKNLQQQKTHFYKIATEPQKFIKRNNFLVFLDKEKYPRIFLLESSR